jgi:type IV secretory pathway VirB3-like protein
MQITITPMVVMQITITSMVVMNSSLTVTFHFPTFYRVSRILVTEERAGYAWKPQVSSL